MKSSTRYKLEELVDDLNHKIHRTVVTGKNVGRPFNAEEDAQYVIADVALAQDGRRKGFYADAAKTGARALRRKRPELRNLSALFGHIVGSNNVADIQHDLEKAGMIFSKKGTLLRHHLPAR